MSKQGIAELEYLLERGVPIQKAEYPHDPANQPKRTRFKTAAEVEADHERRKAEEAAKREQ